MEIYGTARYATKCPDEFLMFRCPMKYLIAQRLIQEVRYKWKITARYCIIKVKSLQNKNFVVISGKILVLESKEEYIRWTSQNAYLVSPLFF